MHQLNNVIFIQVPEGAKYFEIEDSDRLLFLNFSLPDKQLQFIDLPAGHTYEILGLFPELGEEVCKGLVQGRKGMIYTQYKDYTYDIEYYPFGDAYMSLRSFLLSHNMNPDYSLAVKMEKI